ncbi:hypothetical protein V2J09_020907 [Rumex salicifolius]
MAVNLDITGQTSSDSDPLLPWLLSIKTEMSESGADLGKKGSNLEKLVSDCIATFKRDYQYRNDHRFLKIWFLYMDFCGDFDRVYNEIEESEICLNNSLLYELCAIFLEAKGRLVDALTVYKIGISRNAQPIDRLKKAQGLFLDRLSKIVCACSRSKVNKGEANDIGNKFVNPWSDSTIKELLGKIKPRILKYEGYQSSSKNCPQRSALTMQNSSRNKTIELGGRKYLVKGCAGQGGFAQVFKAHVNSDPNDVVALKVQKPPFPWEFYMYRQLDMKVLEKERVNFGVAQWIHHYVDYSILVCDYLSHGTLQDAINSYAVVGGFMEEELCIYYTIEMLCMLEILHGVGIIHGDFKPDNLLIRYARENLPVEEEDFHDRKGPWHDQGLCLVDWGRGIDCSLFPDDMEFMGDCRTSGFRCIEMQENKHWKFQVDTYGLCVIVHMMLHSTYMTVEKKTASDGSIVYMPKLPFKRYWNVNLWERLFKSLLNVNPGDDQKTILADLRKSFQDYMCSNPPLIKKLKQQLLKLRSSLCSS